MFRYIIISAMFTGLAVWMFITFAASTPMM